MSECESLICNNPSLALLSAAAIAEQLGSEVRTEQPLDGRFAFEEAIDCLPMHVKRKLDRVALRIRRTQWLGMSPEGRGVIGRLPASQARSAQLLGNWCVTFYEATAQNQLNCRRMPRYRRTLLPKYLQHCGKCARDRR